MKRITWLHRVFSVLGCLLPFAIGATVLYCASRFEIMYPSVVNVIAYFLCFAGLPVLAFFLVRKSKLHRYCMMVVLIPILCLISLWYYFGVVEVQSGVESYLVEESEFATAARFVLPANRELLNEAECKHIRANAGFECIELIVPLSRTQYDSFIQEQADHFSDLTVTHSGAPYYFGCCDDEFVVDYHVYSCYVFNMDYNDYAVAYTTCAENQTIRYLFFSAKDLASMSVGDVWEMYSYIYQRYK